MKKNNQKNNSLKDKILDYVPILGMLVIVLLIAVMVSNEKHIAKNMKIHNITFSEYQEKVKEDQFNIFILGMKDCSHCADYKPVVNQIANKYDLEVWYLDTNELEYDEYVYLHDNISVLKDRYDDAGNPGIPTPVTVIYRNNYELDSRLGDIGQNGFLNMLNESGVVKK